MAAVFGASVGLGALALGCSDSGDEIAVNPTTTESTSTTGSTTATTESATTESTPTTLDDEAAIRELHQYYLTDVWNRDEREVTLDEQIEEYEAIAVDPLLSRATAALSDSYGRGEYAINPGAESNITSIEISGKTALVSDCLLDLGVLYSADGEVLIPADETHMLVEVAYKEVDGQWFISELYTGGRESCEPRR